MQMNSQSETLGALVRGLLEDISTLFRSEIALAKIEIRQAIAGLGGVGALFAAALVFVLLAMAFLFVTLVLVLAIWIPAWASSLIVAVTLILLAISAAMLGRKRLRETDFAPMEAIRGMKQDVDLIKQEIQRVRGSDDDEE